MSVCFTSHSSGQINFYHLVKRNDTHFLRRKVMANTHVYMIIYVHGLIIGPLE